MNEPDATSVAAQDLSSDERTLLNRRFDELGEGFLWRSHVASMAHALFALIAKTQGAQIDVFATYYKKADGVQEEGPGFKSILITKKGSKFTSLDSVKGSVMLLVDPASTSGALIPESIFGGQVAKMPLKNYFGKVAFSGGHDLSTNAIFEGKADTAFVATHRFMNAITASKGKMKVEDFNILWTSPLIPQDPFVVRTALCPELRKKIADTYLTLDQNDVGKAYLQNVDSLKFVVMKDSDYDVIRQAGGGK